MANSKVIIEVVSTSKGLKMTAKEVDNVTKATEGARKSRSDLNKESDKYNKKEKAIHQSNLSSAKGFSKMKETMGSGSSGLVGAYATLAANVFAATAAFNALRRAAQVETLVEGFTFLADTAGRTSTVIANNIQSITNNALSMEEAMRTSAIAITSGFSTTQLERLVEVGKNASIALGRNLGDSIDRLIRGVAKLEPEILDELGILVRVDTASRKYAAGLGKVASELTDFEKRQAFLNATIEQGEEKYSALAAQVDVNAFDKLAGTFANLTHNVMTFTNTAIKPLVAGFANSQVAMFGAITFLAKGVIGTMFPMLTDLGDRYTQTAQKAHMAAEAMKSSAEKAFDAAQAETAKAGFKKTDPGGFKEMVKNAEKGTLSQKEINKGLKSLRISEALREKNLKANDVKDRKRKEAELQRIRDLIKETEKLKATEAGRGVAGVGAARSAGRAEEQDIIATGAGAIGGAGGLEGFGIAKSTFADLRAEIKVTDTEVRKSFTGKGARGAMQSFGQTTRNAFKTASGGVRLFGAAAINAIPLFGQMVFVVGVLTTVFQKFFGMSKKVSEAIDNLNTVTESMPQKFETLRATTEVLESKIKDLEVAYELATTAAERMSLQYDIQRQKALMLANEIKVTAGIQMEFADSIAALGKELRTADPSRFTMMWSGLKQSFKETTGEVFNLTNATKAYLKVMSFMPGAAGISAQAALDLMKTNEETGKSQEELTKALNTERWTLYSREVQDAYDQIKDPDAKKAIDALGGIDKIMERAAKKSDKFAVRLAFVAAELRNAAKAANAQQASIEAIGPAFEQVTKKMIAFADRNAKKNAFITMGKDLGEFSSKLKDLVKTSGATTADELLNIDIPRELSDVMTAYGLTREDILGTLKTEVDENGKLKVIGEDAFSILAESFKVHGLMVESYKEELKARNDALKARKAELDAATAQYSIDLKLENLRKRGVYEMNPELEQKAAKTRFQNETKFATEAHDTAMKNAGAKYALEFNNAKKNHANDKVLMKEKQDAALALYIEETNLADKTKEKAIRDINDVFMTAKSKAGTEGSTLDRLGSLAVSRDGTEGFQQQITDMQNAAQPMLETLRSLGPDGEFAAAAISGTLSIAKSIETIGEAGFKSAEGLEAMGSIVGQVGSIMAAQSRANIAEVDKQIQAEKNRDGKSKESLAKIAAMEKKKEQMERKAFERNKQMQIAETIINTAAAVMKASPNIPMMLLMGAMGVAQLAVIQKTQFQGGGSSDIPKPAQSIGIGKRDNKVDVSKRATAGELSYLRGEKGIGSTANKFTPTGAAGMRRSYSAGGEILVGEQGPEVIQPTTSGYNVIPNDKMGGQNLNANITINAIDAVGVQEVLTEQRGNIIGMIREAAHEHGEEFIESVNTSAYGSTSNTEGGYG